MKEAILLESPTLRELLCTPENTEVLNKIGEPLKLLPMSNEVLTKDVAKYYQVTEFTILKNARRYKKEIERDGYKVYTPHEFKEVYRIKPPFKRNYIKVFSQKAVLRLGMVIEYSLIAKEIREYILLNKANIKVIKTPFSDEILEILAILKEQDNKINNVYSILKEKESALKSNYQLISAISKELCSNKEKIEELEENVINIKKVLAALYRERKESSYTVKESKEEYITEKEALILKNKIKEVGDPKKIWHKFKKHFNISKYIYLPRNKLHEALEWLENLKNEKDKND